MNESKFIELLNLYIDHQISPAEAAQLEAEVKSTPERRRVYREYCEMQKACSVLADNFRAAAPAGDPKIVEFKPRRRFPVGAVAYATSLAAVAACVALVFTLRSRPVAPSVVAAPITQQELKASAPTVAVAPVPRPALQPAFGPKVLTLRAQNAELAESAPDQVALTEWMNSIQLSSMPGASAEDLRFDAHATLQPDIRTYRAASPIKGRVEWTAFTFEK